MYIQTKAIVLAAVKYGDNSRVLRCYTKKAGLQAYMINSLKSKKAAVKASMLLPLTQLNIVASCKEKGTLERIKEAKVNAAYSSIPFDPVKNAMAFFMAEVLNRCLKEEQPNAAKYDFVTTACQLLDELDPVPAHFHVAFLIALSRYLGFSPELASAEKGVYFDKIEGVFQVQQPLHPHYLDQTNSIAFKALLNTSLTDQNVRFPKATRKMLLLEVLLYYKFHVDGFGDLKSIGILEELFQ